MSLPTDVVLANSPTCSTAYQPNPPCALFCHSKNAKLSFEESGKATILIQQGGQPPLSSAVAATVC